MLEIIKNAEDAKLIELRIVQWGKWVRVGSRCDGARGINPIAAMMDKVNPTGSSSPMISDDEAELIGDAVMVLARAEPE
ncbi:hypothetical protein, partial [Marinagarivorans algicola]|uniref:hypothetical protein n=1 Tax=Marinagarivorans algicola TaxID=1513270 RepID=UPI00192E4BB6